MTARKLILVVDDVPANVGALLDVLHTAGHEVAVAESGESALEQLAWLRPDLVLLDVMMPGLDGFATCARLKTNETAADIPVIFMTALDDIADKVRGFSVGGVDYIAKPFQAEEVLARVNTHLRLREQQALLEQRADELDREVQRRVLAEREVQRALDRALIVATRDGAILFASRQASALLARFFPESVSGQLPPALRDGKPPGNLKVSSSPGEHGVAYLLDTVAPVATPALLAPLGLTPRETEILFWVAQGKTNAEIGCILGAASATVKKHVENLLPKLGAETRLAAALRAAEFLRPS